MKYKDINKKHEDYCHEHIYKLKLLYSGGDDILKNANLFIFKEINETEIAYQYRLKSAAYRNYLSEITNSYISEIFQKTISVLPENTADNPNTLGTNIKLDSNYDKYYEEFSENCDLKSTSLVNKLKYILQEAVVTGRSYIQIDFPKITKQPLNIIEEKQLGLSRPYITTIPVECVVDWSIDELTGKYNWILIKSIYKNKTNFFDQSNEIIQFKLWFKTDKGVGYKIFEIKKQKDKEPEPEEEVVLVDEGKTTFKEIPIFAIEPPSELNLGQLIGNLCIEHFRQYSSLIFAQKRNLFSIPVYQMGPEISASGDYSEISQDPNRGEQSIRHMRQKGFAVTGPEDKIYFAEPSGSVYSLITEQLNDLQKEIHRVASIQASAIKSGSLSESGISKAIDNRAKEIVLTAYGELVKQFVNKIYTFISQTRNEDIKWLVLGLDNYKLSINREQLITEATSIQLINIPSKTFQKALYLQVATQLIDTLTPQEQVVIKQEISDAIDRGEHEIDAEEMNEDKEDDNKTEEDTE